MSEERIRDLVVLAKSIDVVSAHLTTISTAITNSAQWVKEHLARDERNLALLNILVAPSDCIDLCTRNLSGSLALQAFCTRTVFELDLRLRHVLLSEANLKTWIAEAAKDRLELLEGMIALGETGDSKVQVLRGEQKRIEAIIAKHQLRQARPLAVATLAQEVGLEEERKSLFKLFSKLVHPSSYLVNSGNIMSDTQMRHVLLLHFQLYLLDLVKRVTDELGVPPELIPISLGKIVIFPG
jgi:hypothetical protein